MTDLVDVVIVGAGPYGLSLAAHLRAAEVPFRIFGSPMALWRDFMPRGMQLKSHGFASNLSSPDGNHTLEAFCSATGRAYHSDDLPVSLDTFSAYGLWFADELVPDLEQTFVTRIAPAGEQYEITLASGEELRARAVVVAAGVQHFATVPDELSAVPAEACTHSAAHSDLSVFAGQRVIVLGAGQSALESAALLHENGASVQLVARADKLAWNSKWSAANRSLIRQLRRPATGLGPGWQLWFYSRHAQLFRRLPGATRLHRALTTLGPAGAEWLADRFHGKVPVLLGHELRAAEAGTDGVRLTFQGPDGTTRELTADHVIAGTGYRPDLQRLSFLDDSVLAGLQTFADTPVLDRSFQSSAPGLYFIGAVAAVSFGPLMRFAYGADFAARTVAARLTRAVSQHAGDHQRDVVQAGR